MKVKDALRSWPAQTAATTAFLFLACFVLACYCYGSPRVAYAVLRGAVITPDAYVQSAMPTTSAESSEARFRLRNWSDRPVRLMGAGVSCTCVLVQPLPLTIPARGEVIFDVVVRPKPNQAPTKTNQRIVIYTDNPQQATLLLEVACVQGPAIGVEIVR